MNETLFFHFEILFTKNGKNTRPCDRTHDCAHTNCTKITYTSIIYNSSHWHHWNRHGSLPFPINSHPILFFCNGEMYKLKHSQIEIFITINGKNAWLCTCVHGHAYAYDIGETLCAYSLTPSPSILINMSTGMPINPSTIIFPSPTNSFHQSSPQPSTTNPQHSNANGAPHQQHHHNNSPKQLLCQQQECSFSIWYVNDCDDSIIYLNLYYYKYIFNSPLIPLLLHNTTPIIHNHFTTSSPIHPPHKAMRAMCARVFPAHYPSIPTIHTP